LTLTYDGPISGPLDGLRTLIAASSTFQTWAQADDAADAKNNIFIGEVADADLVYPYAQILPGENWNYAAIATYGGVLQFMASGEVQLVFEGLVPDEYVSSSDNATFWWVNQMEGIIADICEIAGTGTYFACRGIHQYFGPARTDTAERVQNNDTMLQVFRVSWGFGNAG